MVSYKISERVCNEIEIDARYGGRRPNKKFQATTLGFGERNVGDKAFSMKGDQ
jgi:hypothetical protein